MELTMQLTRFNEIDFLPALKEFFGKSNLNVPINYVDDKPVSAKKYYRILIKIMRLLG